MKYLAIHNISFGNSRTPSHVKAGETFELDDEETAEKLQKHGSISAVDEEDIDDEEEEESDEESGDEEQELTSDEDSIAAAEGEAKAQGGVQEVEKSEASNKKSKKKPHARAARH